MKIRSGFVSNSSSCSFTVFGWRMDQKTKEEDASDLKDLLALTPEIRRWFHTCYPPDGGLVIGVGVFETEIDHYMEDWEDYVSEGAPEYVEDWLLAKAKELNLPIPEHHSYTYYE